MKNVSFGISIGVALLMCCLLPPVAMGNITGSTVTVTGSYTCFEPEQTKRICFSVHNASTDGERIEGVYLLLPTGWDAACFGQEESDSCANQIDLECSNPSDPNITIEYFE
jgi:hypothetical protein